MIIVTRLGSQRTVAVNPDLIERIESTPDTVITAVDGHKFVITESVAEVVGLVRSWRASVVAEAFALTHGLTDPATTTAAAPGPDDAVATALDTHATLDSSLARVLRLPTREV